MDKIEMLRLWAEQSRENADAFFDRKDIVNGNHWSGRATAFAEAADLCSRAFTAPEGAEGERT